ncbi:MULTISPECIES: flagellar basal body rod protein FlgC [Paenibacillus]|jgi:flagellar basal-body rod protein FlgC|uniref:Flagellar basal-body rod protein FlgC n=1 Tax=Paenibacillus odorifer TaxID=189426 RepID=A0A1R0X317_9BACL|nr:MULTISPECIES: flagellar basal body rod protein FlgC [Paenibacillus]AIQ75089.1 flagellar basal body rod protein FlgC [Paenibacillus odorifer]AWV34406.1 flagellar basal body rod protein FlgC [Paenibacillus odorifer]ETT45956.1 flagellar basal-body rod protein flgC [Paenibacillus sp. FSL H8-237]MDH6428129.1 flagellar basal-body rod protein FlgC [Paenibacillus sp. PastH-4]MDH6444239.1 flagellar basal-body rod protein FlgC [Paenibacillus sp. PastF-4]
MNFGSSFGISASALTAQRLRMDVISSNVANAETTRASVVDGKAVPYRRKLVVLETNESNKFSNILNSKMNNSNEGVKVQSIIEDTSPLKPVYNPSHPDADAEGYVYMPNVDITKEMVDMLSASRSYDANVTMLNASKAMVSKALEIGR